MHLRFVSRVGAVVAMVAAAGAGAAVIASASGDSIHACAAKGSGILRVASARKPCAKKDQKLTRGTTGPAGPVGPAGPQGPKGDAGAQGPAGPVHQVASAVNGNGTSQAPSAAYTVAKTGTHEYTIQFPAAEFTNLPVCMVTPIGASVGDIVESFNAAAGKWQCVVTLSADTTFNFLASQLS